MTLKRKVRLKKKIKITLLYSFFIAIIVYSVINIISWDKDNKVNRKVKKEIIDDVQIEIKNDKDETYIETDLNKLKEINSDTVAWIYYPNTNINYPVVQTDNNDFYLNKNFYKNTNDAGWIFLDYRNILDGSNRNTILYGHNRLDGSMFGTLNKALNGDWLQSNKYLYFNTLDTFNTYIVFSAYSINAKDFKNNTSFSSIESYQNYINEIKSKSIVDLGIEVNSDDQILTLYTCALNNVDRTIVHAKLIQSVKKD